MKLIGVIPARYESTRFPGKPLSDIGGKSMIQRVYEQASKASMLDEVIVATDDIRIEDEVSSFGGQVVLTSTQHKSGTDRCREAVEKSESIPDAIINIQGDEPFIQPEQIDLVASCFKDKNTQIATLAKRIESVEDLLDTNIVKVHFGDDLIALAFSRQPVPKIDDIEQSEWLDHGSYYKHIGIYGYRWDVLQQITHLQQSPQEIRESLEQLRWMENKYPISIQITDHDSTSVDTPEDLEKLLKTLT